MGTAQESRRIRLALAAIVLPLTLAIGGCSNRPNDSPTTVPPPATTSETIVVVGRPLRRRNGRLRLARSRRGHSHLTDRQALLLSPSVRKLLGDHWRAQGEMEHASVVAFHDLARRLVAVGAPTVLCEQAVRCARQEADHTERCFDLAGRYLGQTLHPGRLHRPLRLPPSRKTELARLAVEALRDGVLNEGYAAWLAAGQAERATDARVRDTLLVIARDEAEHAELSAAVLAWCLAEGGFEVATAVEAAAAFLPAAVTSCVIPPGVDAAALADHGLFDPDGAGYGNATGYASVLAATHAVVPQMAIPTVDRCIATRRTTGRQLLRNRRTASGARTTVRASDHAMEPQT